MIYLDRNAFIDAISKDPAQFKLGSQELRSDKMLVTYFLRLHPELINDCCSSITGNIYTLREFINARLKIYPFLRPDLKNEKLLAEAHAHTFDEGIKDIPDQFRLNDEFCLETLRAIPYVLSHMDTHYQTSVPMALEAIKSFRRRKNQSPVNVTIKMWDFLDNHINHSLFKRMEFCREVTPFIDAYNFAFFSDFLDDKEFSLYVARYQPSALICFSDRIRDDIDCAIQFLMSGALMNHLSPRLSGLVGHLKNEEAVRVLQAHKVSEEILVEQKEFIVSSKHRMVI